MQTDNLQWTYQHADDLQSMAFGYTQHSWREWPRRRRFIIGEDRLLSILLLLLHTLKYAPLLL
jgi:hypothetical protein